MTHDFDESLRKSHKTQDLPIWEGLYRQFFGQLYRAMHDHRQDGDHQRLGVDRSIILHNAKVVYVDEKARGEDYGDIALEYWSDSERKIRGWVCKDLWADYIAYAILPSGKAYLLPVLQLRTCWAKKRLEWVRKYPKISAENALNGRRWTTLSVGVPPDVLLRNITGAMCGTFDPT